MRTITTMNNGNIYQMDITEAIEIVQDYARLNTGGDLSLIHISEPTRPY